MQLDRWRLHFEGFSFPYGFYGPEEYEQWLEQIGLKRKRIELISKKMTQEGSNGLAGWVRTTWLPYTQRVPDHLQETLVSEIVHSYIQAFPLDQQGKAHVMMMRLEVEAKKE